MEAEGTSTKGPQTIDYLTIEKIAKKLPKKFRWKLRKNCQIQTGKNLIKNRS